MIRALHHTPLLIILMGIGTTSMLVPSFYAWVIDDHLTMRVFFYGTILLGLLSLVLGLACNGRWQAALGWQQLLTLVLAFVFLPVIFAVPFKMSLPELSFYDSWFEMVSSFTTTGVSVLEAPLTISPALHIWRALVAWMGGLLIWIAAIATFAPMNLGGFEVRAFTQIERSTMKERQAQDQSPNAIFGRYALRFAPIYVGLTVILWFALTVAGEVSYVALCHAMSVLSTSGITPLEHFSQSASGILGEVFILGFFVFAISHLSFGSQLTGEQNKRILDDPEGRVAVVLIVFSSLFLFLRHFIGPTGVSSENNAVMQIQVLWGAVFTVTSFITTTGFESQAWETTLSWSNLPTPEVLLICLATIGGGVATTAGGVKLLRVYALTRHGERELERLVYPSSIGGGGRDARRIRRKGAYISWLFFMLFAMSVTAVTILLSLFGSSFEQSVLLAVAALSTTGPLLQAASDATLNMQNLPGLAKVVLAAAMVLGRLETLAIVALFNPEIWKK